jgi:hypothetical protein
VTIRGLLLADGRSDLPLAAHVEAMCSDLGADVSLTAADSDLIPASVGRTVRARLAFLLLQGARPDLLFVHRDSEADPADKRRDEVSVGASSAGVTCPVVALVPVRMTEAWLLLDEAAIRQVAGRPGGKVPLDLPSPARVESLADPKQKLAEVLLVASEATGRRRAGIRRDFGRHRALLLQRLDPGGPVSELVAWRRLRDDTAEAIRGLVPPAGE